MTGTATYVSLPDTSNPLSTSLLATPAISSSASESFLPVGSEQPNHRSLLNKLHPYRYYILIVACAAVVLIALVGVVLLRDSKGYSQGYTPPTNSTGGGGDGGGGGGGGRSGGGNGGGGFPGGDTGGGGDDVVTNSSCPQAKTLTEGPYWINEMLNRSDLYSTAAGQMLSVEVLVYNTSVTDKCVPVTNALVDLWTSDAEGLYSDIQQLGTKGKTFLRGYQTTNSAGIVNFLTIWPGWYQGRTVHMHFRVRVFAADGTTVILNQTTQLFLNDDTSDAIFAAVSPYNKKTTKRDTYNRNDGLYSAAMFMNTTGSIKDGFHGSFALGVPFLR